VFTGSSLHDELQMMVDAGLAPIDALRSATIYAAEFAGASGVHGSIAPGKVADLVLLDGDPLVNIAHTRRIAGVFFGGRYFDDGGLHVLQEFVRVQVGGLRANLRLLWDLLASPLMRRQLVD
jgi:imidazolonepropionase-like amidohydrolase